MPAAQQTYMHWLARELIAFLDITQVAQSPLTIDLLPTFNLSTNWMFMMK